MNSLCSSSKLFVAIICLLFVSLEINAQWAASNIYQPTYRYGNTGIGTASPSTLLHMYASSSEQTLLRLERYDGFNRGIWLQDINKYGYFQIANVLPGTKANVRFTINDIGNVGIGTTSPDEKLEVIGNGEFSENLYVGDRLGIGTTSPGQLLTLSAPNEPVLRFDRQGSNWDYEIYVTGGGSMRFRGGGNGNGGSGNEVWGDKMVITGKGYVGIGMSNVSSSMVEQNGDGEDYLLYVKGGIITEEVKVETGWCDYVFEEDYDLLPLEEVEAHIAARGHLPNVPSAKVIESEGLELKSMTVNQQEKIEELFLHMIEMNKTMKAMQVENEMLKTKLESLKK